MNETELKFAGRFPPLTEGDGLRFFQQIYRIEILCEEAIKIYINLMLGYSVLN